LPGNRPKGRAAHDQSFKNLILDLPRESLAFFAGTVLPPDAEIVPMREEMLKERLGDRFRELDVPLLVTFPDGSREAIVFDLEEHTDPRTFDVVRLAHYYLDLVQLAKTTRVVPVVVFVKPGEPERELVGAVDGETYLTFRYVSCELSRLPARERMESANVVERLLLPLMAHSAGERLSVYNAAIEGLGMLPGDPNLIPKYEGFVDQYAKLDDDERAAVKASKRASTEARMGTGYVTFLKELGREEGLEQGIERGIEQGLAKGMEKGIEKGMEKGMEKGIEKGIALALVALVRTGQLTHEQARASLRQQAADGTLSPSRLADLEAQLDVV